MSQRIAFVTGASRGIGRAAALAFARLPDRRRAELLAREAPA